MLSLSIFLMMKLLLSSSASSCSSSLSKTASAGCLAVVFRNFFCSGSLPTYPSDQTAEESDALNLIAEGNMANKSAPGVVARLMGLDSLPEIDVDQAQSAPNSISLSRSMNSVDCLCERSGSQHRRVKSTLSLRELPIFFNTENEDFLVLSFENVKESKEFRRRKRDSQSRERKTEKLPEKKKEEEPEEIKRVVLKNLNDEEKLSRRISANSTLPSKDYGRSKLSENSSIVIHHKQISGDRKLRTKASVNHDGIKMEEAINISEDSSPVSVLDRCQFLGDPELPTSDDSVSAGLNSRRKLSTELENYENPCPRNDNNLLCDDDEHILMAKEIIYVGERRKELHKRSQMCEIIRRLTEAEMVGSRCNNGDLQSVAAEIQWVMLEELIDEERDLIKHLKDQIFEQDRKMGLLCNMNKI